MERIRLKLDMVYRGFPIEEARAKYAELAAVIQSPVVEVPVERRRIRPTEGGAPPPAK